MRKLKIENELVSIVTPTYNSQEYIEEAVLSVINQTYTNWELIIVDDCSKDETRRILKKIAASDARVNVIYSNVNSGSGISRNIGLKHAKGQYVAFLDSDDIWEFNKLELQIDYLRKTNAAICHTSFSFVDENGDDRPGRVHASKSVDLERNLKRTEIGTSTAIINRNIIQKEFLFPSMRARQDLKLWIELLSSGYNSVGLDVPLVKYRVRSGSVSSNKFKMLYVTFKVYISIYQLPLPKRLFCYCCYVLNAIKKRGE